MSAATAIVDFPVRPIETRFEGGTRDICLRDDSLWTDELRRALWQRWIIRASPRDGLRHSFHGTEVELAENELAISVAEEAERFRMTRKEMRYFMERSRDHGRITWRPILGPIRGQSGANRRPIGLIVTICNLSYYRRGESIRGQSGANQGPVLKKEEKTKNPKPESCSPSEPSSLGTESHSTDGTPRDNRGASSGKAYAFEGKVIRLLREDFDRWTLAFSTLDLRAELTSLDAFYAEPGELRRAGKGWFVRCSAALCKKHKLALEKLRSSGKRQPPVQATLFDPDAPRLDDMNYRNWATRQRVEGKPDDWPTYRRHDAEVRRLHAEREAATQVAWDKRAAEIRAARLTAAAELPVLDQSEEDFQRSKAAALAAFGLDPGEAEEHRRDLRRRMGFE